jgi:hypothetical protein
MDDQRTNRESGRSLIPRFSIAALLIASAVVAVWFSTFYRYTGSDDVRATIWLAIVIVPGAAAAYSEGARRAFWGGFFATEFILVNRNILNGGPRFLWAVNKPNGWGSLFTEDRTQWNNIQSFAQATVTLVGWLVIGVVFGLICVYIRSRCRSKKI